MRVAHRARYQMAPEKISYAYASDSDDDHAPMQPTQQHDNRYCHRGDPKSRIRDKWLGKLQIKGVNAKVGHRVGARDKAVQRYDQLNLVPPFAQVHKRFRNGRQRCNHDRQKQMRDIVKG